MKHSIRRRHCALFSAILLSTCSAAWAVPADQAKARPPSPAQLMHEAQRLSSEKSLAEATVAARAAMEAGRKGSAMDYTDLEAGALLVDLLHQQGRYDEARKAAEEQIAYWERQAAAVGSTSRHDTRITSMLGVAIEASMMAGERAEVTRLEEKLFAVVNPGPGLWRLSPDEPRLHYELADFSTPLLVEQWKLAKFEPAEKRDDATQLLYTQTLANGRLSAEISLVYDEAQRKYTASQRQDWLKPYQEQTKPRALASAMPDLPFDDLTAVKLGRQEECEGEQCTNIRWTALRGDWRMDIDVMFKSRDEAQAIEQMHKLFATLKWQSAPPLFRERTMAEQTQDMDSTWELPGGWSKAAELAKKALPDAFFPDEVARVQTLIGVSQYRHGDFDAARHSLGLALPAWENGSSYLPLYRTALDYAADIAYRQGRTQEAIALNRKLIEWQQSDATLGWGTPKDENALVNSWKGIHLPLRVGDYRLRTDTENRFYYENLQTGAQLGLTVDSAQTSDEQLESLLRAFMVKKLGLQAADMRKTKFSPKSAEPGKSQATGQIWEFDVTKLPGEQGPVSDDFVAGIQRKTPTKMTFWIVDREGVRSLLRAPIMEGGQSGKEANQIAQALSW